MPSPYVPLSFTIKTVKRGQDFRTHGKRGVVRWRFGPLDEFKIEFEWDDVESQLLVGYEYEGKYYVRRIAVREVSTAVGVRHFFVCPITDKFCIKLFFYRNRIGIRDAVGMPRGDTASRTDQLADSIVKTANRLEGKDGRGPARGARRLALQDKLDEKLRAAGRYEASLREWYGHLTGGNNFLVRLQRDLARVRRAERLEDICDSPLALKRAETAYAGFEDATLERAASGLAKSKLPPRKRRKALGPGVLPADIAILEDHARIDVRVLARSGLIKPGQKTPLLLDWGDIDTELDGVHGFINLSDPDNPALELECMCAGEPTYQKVRLALSNGTRPSWRAMCPVTEKEVYVLAFRGGRFASRQAQRLVNRSQREAPG